MENLQAQSQLRQNPSFVVLRVNNNGAPTIGTGTNTDDFDFAAFEQLQFQGNTINIRGGAGGGGAGHGINSVRNHLFHVMLVKLSLAYAQHTSPRIRRFIEFISLAFALLCFFMILYIHLLVPAVPTNCLDNIKETWPKRGIVRIEVVKSWKEYNSYISSLQKQTQHQTHFSLKDVFIHGPSALPQELKKVNKIYEVISDPELSPSDTSFFTWFSDAFDVLFDIFIDPVRTPSSVDRIVPERSLIDLMYDVEEEKEQEEVNNESNIHGPFLYIVEYSLHHGLLRLPVDLRNYYNIPVMLVQLSADDENQCLAPYRNQGFNKLFMGYDDILMNSVKSLSENYTEKGYLYDLIKNEHYHFVSYAPNKFVYLTALFVMLIFTFAISMLLRFSHHQIFLFIVDLLHMFELNQPLVFPIAPLLTVLLALVGMEAIMSEVFIDTTTAFYVILLVWIADQYDAICCHSQVGRKHWLKFFYLYHYTFYAYHYRYSGQYTGAALITSAAFVIHSMIFFFHHYELPLILYSNDFQQLIRQLRQQGNEFRQLGRNVPTTSDSDSATHIGEINRGLLISRNIPEPLRTDILREAERMNVRVLNAEMELNAEASTPADESIPSTEDSSNQQQSFSSSSLASPSTSVPSPSAEEIEEAEIIATNLVQQTMNELFDTNFDAGNSGSNIEVSGN